MSMLVEFVREVLRQSNLLEEAEKRDRLGSQYAYELLDLEQGADCHWPHMPFAWVAEKFFQDYAASHKPRSVKACRRKYELACFFMESQRVSEVRPNHVSEMAKNLSEEFDAATVRSTENFVKQVIRWVVKLGYIELNPLKTSRKLDPHTRAMKLHELQPTRSGRCCWTLRDIHHVEWSHGIISGIEPARRVSRVLHRIRPRKGEGRHEVLWRAARNEAKRNQEIGEVGPLLRRLAKAHELLLTAFNCPEDVTDPAAVRLEHKAAIVDLYPYMEQEDVNSGPVANGLHRPIWRRGEGKLFYRNQCVKRILRVRQARNVVAVLDAFHESGWPDRIDDPLPGGKNPTRLNDTVKSLNSNLQLLRFCADGGSTGYVWSAEI